MRVYAGATVPADDTWEWRVDEGMYEGVYEGVNEGRRMEADAYLTSKFSYT
jgi:hypothetical protein